MYIAGLGLPFAEPQALNGLACASLAGSFYLSFPGSGHWKNTEKKAGKAVHMPKGSRGLYISIAHGLVLLGPSLLFLFTIPPNKFAQPDWLTKYALPEATPRVYYVVRMGSCASLWWAGLIMTRCFKHLDAQWNYIGVRERPSLIRTGPYKIVRHPMYSCAMLVMASMTGAFWNWIPAPALGLLAALFAIKMPMEENIILGHDQMGPKYAVYKREVPYRAIPYVW